MKTILFHPTNTFTIYKKSGEPKIHKFNCHKVGLYYKLYQILRKKDNYHLSTATIHSITGSRLANGNFHNIYQSLIAELNEEYKYSIITKNSVYDDVYHWREDSKTVKEFLENIKEKYTHSNDPRLCDIITVQEHEFGCKTTGYIDELISIFSCDGDVQSISTDNAEEAEFGVYLDFEEVLKDMRQLILNGTEKEKIEAKAILAYVAQKLAEK